jgi:hypothetical protein
MVVGAAVALSTRHGAAAQVREQIRGDFSGFGVQVSSLGGGGELPGVGAVRLAATGEQDGDSGQVGQCGSERLDP